jgi:hypothetical protein
VQGCVEELVPVAADLDGQRGTGRLRRLHQRDAQRPHRVVVEAVELQLLLLADESLEGGHGPDATAGRSGFGPAV